MLVGRRHDLVPRLESEAADHDRAALGRRARERDLDRLHADEACERDTELVTQRERLLEVLAARPALGEVVRNPGRERIRDGDGQRPERARVEVRDPLEHREQRACLCERHPASTSTTHSTGAWSESTTPFLVRRPIPHAVSGPAGAPRTRMWSIPSHGGE